MGAGPGGGQVRKWSDAVDPTSNMLVAVPDSLVTTTTNPARSITLGPSSTVVLVLKETTSQEDSAVAVGLTTEVEVAEVTRAVSVAHA